MSDQAAEHEGTPIKSATSPDLPATHSIAPNQWSPRMILKAIVDDQVYTLKVPEPDPATGAKTSSTSSIATWTKAGR
jgi:hypothetical protein